MKRNNFLDVLKGICIVCVIMAHFDWTDSQKLAQLFPYWVTTTVPILMMISGYVHTESFQRKNIETFKQAYSLKGILDKVIRYTVPFLLIYIIEIPLKMLVFQMSIDPITIFFQFWQGGYGPGAYYYPFMMQFIFLFPLIYFIVKKWDIKGLILCGALNVVYELVKIPLEMTADPYRLLVFRYIFAIAFGCYISIGKFQFKKWMGVLSCAFGAAFIYLVCYTDYQPVIFYRWSRTSMLAVFFTAPIVYWLIKKATWECKSLALMGRASYNIYLVQMVYFYIVDFIVYDVDGTFWPMLGTYLFCILVGIWFYKKETPITKKVLSWNEKLFAKNY